MMNSKFPWVCVVGWLLAAASFPLAGAAADSDEAVARQLAEMQRIVDGDRPQDAIPMLEKLAVQHPAADVTGLHVLMRLQLAYFKSGRQAEADKITDQIVRRFPGNPETEVYVTTAIRKEKNASSKARLVESYLKDFPTGAHRAEIAALQPGASAVSSGSVATGMTDAALGKDWTEALKLLAAKRTSDAIRILEKLEFEHRDSAAGLRVLLALHSAYMQERRSDGARKTAEKILSRFPAAPETEPFLWAAIQRESNADEKAGWVERYLKVFPQGPNVKAAQALKTVAVVKDARGGTVAEQREAAEKLYQDRQFTEALKVYESMKAGSTEAEFVQFRIAFCKWWLRDYKTAVRLWLELADKTPGSRHAPEALQMAGRTYCGPLRDGDKALGLFQRILKEHGKSAEAEPAAYSVAVLNYWLKRKEAAKKAFQEFIQNYPQSIYVPAAHKILADL